MPIPEPSKLLLRLVKEPSETGWLEFKVNNWDPDEIGQYVSALANAAMLAEKDRGFLVFGVDNNKKLVGTRGHFADFKKGGEPFENWLNRMIEPKLMIELVDFEHNGKSFSIAAVEPTYDRPVKFSGYEYIRIGESKRRLADFPEHERALWLATGRRRFENAIALSNQTEEQVMQHLDIDTMYNLADQPKPKSSYEVMQRLISRKFIVDNMDDHYDITNLGAIILANDIEKFPSISNKSIRIVKYAGKDKSRSEFEHESKKGYAVDFVSIIKLIMSNITKEEKYIDGVRRIIPHYPETAIRETVANALIHQDFTISGSGPVIEIYNNRVEITNPGNSLINIDRMLDERRSRNEKLASTMRELGICEERGGGLDKTFLEIERLHLPAPDLVSSEIL